MQAQETPASPAPPLLQRLRGITLEHLWLASVLALIWLFISLTPLPPNDLWWHMAAGRAMLEKGQWLTTNRWAYTLPADAPYTYQSWLSEIVLYLAWQIGDVPLLALTRTLAVTLAYALVAWHAWRRVEGRGKAVALALFLAVLVGWNNWTLRPQTLVLLPGAAFVVVLGEYLGGRLRARWLAALPLLMMVWVNMHGSFALGVGLLGLAWLGQLFSAAGKSEQAAAARQCLLPLTAAVLGTLLATIVHPLGIGIFGYVYRLLSDPPSQSLIIEWQPPTNAPNPFSAGFWFFLMLFLLAVLMSAGPRRPSAVDLLWYCALGWLTVSGERYAIWFALLLLPLLAEQLASTLLPRRPSAGGNPVFTLTYGAFLAAMMLAVLPWFSPARYLGAGAEPLFAAAGPHHMLLSSSTPLAASEWLEAHPIEGRFWTDMSYSSYTIWRLPEKQVFADLRIDMFPQSIWEDYRTISRGGPDSLAMIDEWQISHILLDSNFQSTLDERLAAAPQWCETYRDVRAVVFVRCEQASP